MTIKERNQELRMVAELMEVHLPNSLADSDLCKDMCVVVAINLRRFAVDGEKSANEWDKRAYHSKADELRREMTWALPADQIAESIAYSPKPFSAEDLKRLKSALPSNLEAELGARLRFKDPEAMRGAAAAARQTLLKKR